MIRQISKKDKTAIEFYLSTKLRLSFLEASVKTRKIIKSGLPALIMESKELQGICWAENRIVDDKKVKYIEILVNNWRLAEAFIKILRWNLNGDYYLSIPKHDFLNRTYNKNGIRFLKVNGKNNEYITRFEKRTFYNFKKDDVK